MSEVGTARGSEELRSRAVSKMVLVALVVMAMLAAWVASGTSATVLLLSGVLLAGVLVGFVAFPARRAAGQHAQEPSGRLAERLRHQTDHDALTGLLNRGRFEQELKAALDSVTAEARISVIVLDLDNFRYTNDTLGHKVGDAILRGVAELLTQQAQGVIARLSGDEFAILVREAGLDEALDAAENLVAAIRDGSMSAGGRVTASAGVALHDGIEPTTAEELLVDADLAMFEAKEAGRDRTALFTPNSQDRVAQRLNWVERIREALDKDLFVLYCQPILDIAHDRVSQYELLVRMVDKDGTIIPPAAFLGTAERFGLITEIDKWVVKRAIGLIDSQRRQGNDLRLEVNLSGVSVCDTELPDVIEREIKATGIDPSNLILEVTETAAIANMDEARRFAGRLADLGCRFALDDFGTGFGSFYYLKHLPLDYVKIDGEFIQNLPYNLTDQLVVKAMAQVAEGLVEQTIAEFVGDDDTIKLLQEYGVDYAQGYHIGRPRPVSDLWSDWAEAA
ncbi:MAG: EAL domain-containing protein [Solirubrobacterales bacterium]